ncbi:DUF4124 domain-containing protein [Methylophaga sp. OBS4]|uniref:DUF4124 domain-containing protein n=1 Tax=Methylophaga sp. OBS4 TaxID=2991935 RepID=UPI0022563248|nr:DUF4124 domain-containing protein [Methylophaga sp. OBS4]MCX4186537.1 DUF4124 domain-containing protein [Methylophaga sp. OBS4]
MRFLTALLALVLVLPVQAEIYKCTVNGKTQFSDQPCSDKAEIIELKIRQPKAEDVTTQQQITQQFKEESRVNTIHSLHEENETLKAQITELEKQREAELEELSQRTYQYDDDTIATKEPGLFQKMNDVMASYQKKIRQIENRIRENENTMSQLQ